MKKYIVTIIALFIIMSSTKTMAQSSFLSKAVITSFATQFEKASDVSWKVTDNFNKATFRINNQYMDAFFSNEGTLIAMSHNILSSELPIQLQLGIMRNYPGTWISDLFEYVVDGNSSYYITLENKDEKFILESTDNSDWHLYKRTIK
jgi:hypothetical protein